MALIKFSWLQDYLQEGDIKDGILSSQEGLHYSDIHSMLLHDSFKMQCIPYQYFSNLVNDNVFTPPDPKLKEASTTTALLLVFTTNVDLMAIEYVHIIPIVSWAKSEALSIPKYVEYIEEDCQTARLESDARPGGLQAHSYCLFLYNFDSMMVTKWILSTAWYIQSSLIPAFPRRNAPITTPRVPQAELGSMNACVIPYSTTWTTPVITSRSTIRVSW